MKNQCYSALLNNRNHGSQGTARGIQSREARGQPGRAGDSQGHPSRDFHGDHGGNQGRDVPECPHRGNPGTSPRPPVSSPTKPLKPMTGLQCGLHLSLANTSMKRNASPTDAPSQLMAGSKFSIWCTGKATPTLKPHGSQPATYSARRARLGARQLTQL